MKKITKIFSLKHLLFAFLLSLFSSRVYALTLTLSHEPKFENTPKYTLSWTSVDPSTDDAKVFYYVFEVFGYGEPDPFFNVNGSTAAFTDETSAVVYSGNGSRCFRIKSIDSLDPTSIFYSNKECHGFIHNLTSEGIQRGDGDGTQRGVDQIWNFTYSLDQDSLVSAAIYPPGTTFPRDPDTGFVISASNPPTRILIDDVPRSGEMNNHSITMKETWDSRNSTGTVVPNGIYYLLMGASLDAGQSGYSESPVRDFTIYSIPVDIIRIMNVTATGISLTNPNATIKYDLTGDSLVRMVIGQPGSHFVVDTSGDIHTADSSGVVDDTLIVSTKTFQRKAGSGLIENWDGTSSTGAVLASGVYPVGLSARDEYGNFAINTNGDDGPIFTTITLERAPGSSSSPGSAADTTAPTLVSISPADNATSNTLVSTMTIVLSDAGGSTLDLPNAAITITSPNTTPVTSYTRTNNTNNNTITLVFSPPLDTNGTYGVSIVAKDVAGNSATITSDFNILIRLDATSFEGSLKIFPNPTKNSSSLTFQYDMAVAGTTKIEIYNIVGERVTTLSFDDAQTTASHVWDLTNSSGEKVGSGVYIARITATGSGSNIELKKKIVVIR